MITIFLDIIKEVDPDMNRQMKSYYKKQMIIMNEDESKVNLVFKLCNKIWEMREDEIRLYKQDIQRLQEIKDQKNEEIKQYKITIDNYKQKQDHLIEEFGKDSHEYNIYQNGDIHKICKNIK